MLIDPEGTARPLAGTPELLLGLLPAAGRTDAEAVLPEGGTLLLHTDGLVERRGESLQVGLDRLLVTVEEVARRTDDLEELCDGVLAAMVPAAPEDDVALLAVRLLPAPCTPDDDAQGPRPPR